MFTLSDALRNSTLLHSTLLYFTIPHHYHYHDHGSVLYKKSSYTVPQNEIESNIIELN